MTPEAKARRQIDNRLEQSGWVGQDVTALKVSAVFGEVLTIAEGQSDRLRSRAPCWLSRPSWRAFLPVERLTDRFRLISYEALMARDRASPDIFWLKDENLDNLDDFASPDLRQREIIAPLDAAWRRAPSRRTF